MGIKTIPLSRLETDLKKTLNECAEPGEIVRPSGGARQTKPEIDEEARAVVYGAAMRPAHDTAAGEPIRRGSIVRPGDRDFLQVVLTPGSRAIAIPVTTGGASTGLLYPGDRVDVILTQNFKGESAVITRRSVSETVVENLRVLAIDTLALLRGVVLAEELLNRHIHEVGIGHVAVAVGKHRFESPGPLEQDKVVNIPAKLGILDIADLLRREGVMDEHSSIFVGG